MFCRSLFVFLSFFIWSIVLSILRFMASEYSFRISIFFLDSYFLVGVSFLILPGHLSFTSVFSGVQVVQYLAFSVWFCKLNILSFFNLAIIFLALLIYFHLFVLIKTFVNRQPTRPSFIYKIYCL
jgi:hypothetical protein